MQNAATIVGEPRAAGPLEALEREAILAARPLLQSLFLAATGNASPDPESIIAQLDQLAGIVARAMILEDLAAREGVMREARQPQAQRAAFTAAQFAQLPFEQAIVAMLGRVQLPQGEIIDVFEAYQRYQQQYLWPQLARDAVQIVNDQVAMGLRAGWTPAQFRDHAGSLGAGVVSDRYAVTVYRTERTNAHAAGRVIQAFSPEADEWIVAWRYRAIGDHDTRSNHAANNGLMWAKRHPVWATRLPPNGYNCRCRIENISRAEAHRLGRMDASGQFISDDVPDKGEPDERFRTSALGSIYGGAT